MSRIGKQPILIPEKTTATQDGRVITVKGPLGELSREFRDDVTIKIADSEITVTPASDSAFSQALWGTYASHLRNMISGVNEPFVKKLIVEGVGFRAELQGANLVMALGFSHPVNMPIPEGIKVEVVKNLITISGINKDMVGRFAAEVRSKKKPEPYKGKGIRYEDEVIRRKEGKRAA